MRATRTFVAVAALATQSSTVACGAGDDTASDAAVLSVDGGADVTAEASADVAITESGASEATVSAPPAKNSAPPPPLAGIRIANWSPDAPAIDLCLANHGTAAFQGPMLGSAFGSQEDASIPALPFPYASAYALVPPGQYDARLVVAGAPDCQAGIGKDVTNLPMLLADGYATVALIGEVNPVGGAPGLKLVGFLDDAFANAGAGLRFINAALSPLLNSATFGKGSGSSLSPFFLAVPFAQAGTAAEAVVPDAAARSVDSYGYLSIASLSGATLSVAAPNGAAAAAIAANVNVAAGAVVTIVAVGANSTALVECVDNAGTLSYLGSCSVISAGGDAGGL